MIHYLIYNMDEKLKAVIDKVLLLSNQNKEFDIELRKALSVPNLYSNQICLIEKYLGLDYSIDSKESIIDYSYIEDFDVKTTLISDNREMMRHRYGTRYHKTDFGEFCRYAHLQAEMLINYYYDTIYNSNINKIKQHIEKINPKAKIQEKTSIGEIPYTTKIWTFCKEHNLDIDIYLNIKNARNALSHRDNANGFDIHEFQNTLKEKEFKLNPDGSIKWVNWKEQTFIKTDEYNQYRFLIWHKSSPFDSVIAALSQLSNFIQRNIKS